MSTPPALPEGYRIEETIPEGASGRPVFRAHSDRAGKEVFLKFLAAAESSEESVRGRFLSESQAASTLKHRYVAQIVDRGVTEEGRAWLATEWVPGASIRGLTDWMQTLGGDPDAEQILRWIASGGDDDADRSHVIAPAPPKPLVAGAASVPSLGALVAKDRFFILAHLFAQAARGLAFAHSKGILHRGVKPSDIRVDPSGRCRVVDFGLGREGTFPPGEGDVPPQASYMAPEQITQRRVNIDSRCDLYSLGAVFFEAMTGALPYPAANLAELRRAIEHHRRKDLTSVDPFVPAPLEKMVLKLLEKLPDDRYELGEAFAQDLERFLNEEPFEVPRTPLLRRVLRRLGGG